LSPSAARPLGGKLSESVKQNTDARSAALARFIWRGDTAKYSMNSIEKGGKWVTVSEEVVTVNES
jgi:hypothetical protein